MHVITVEYLVKLGILNSTCKTVNFISAIAVSSNFIASKILYEMHVLTKNDEILYTLCLCLSRTVSVFVADCRVLQ